ncbi:general transcription factor IIF subunit 1-like [Culicoides brevitarsis]|uniref:general transcription factor IIF subunit 1-like n=1 Tax=Culicoides brevitarsis TaxID=469753 RepID=UPI00307C9146
MERENNMREFKGVEDDSPKFGAAGFRRKHPIPLTSKGLKEELRRRKFGIIAKRYRPDAQPWILKVGGKTGKKFKGIREGGVSDNAAFYVFTHAPDGAIEAYPLYEWYNFQPIQRYKTLSAEDAEQEFSNRKKTLNLFALMLRKRLKGEDDDTAGDLDDENAKKGGKGKKKDLTISEMDEWIDSDNDSDSDKSDKEKKDPDSDVEVNKKKKNAPKKKRKNDVDDEAFEESDDGDEEGRELDYISDSSEADSLPAVPEDDDLQKNLESSESEEEEEKKSGEESEKSDEEKNKKDGKKDEGKETKDKKKKKKQKKKAGDDKKDSSSDFSSDSSDSDNDNSNSKKKKKKDKNGKSGSNSRSGSPSLSQESNKRKGSSMPSDLTSENSNSPVSTPAKKMKLDGPMIPPTFSGVVNSKDDYGITEDAVRRYLMRKPMTTTELLTKFKNKKTGVSSDKLVETMTQILKKINPVKQTIKGKMYLSIKVPK